MSAARPWIAYVGPVPYPEGGAAARRILGNARALAAGGYDVVIVSGQPPGPEGATFDVAPGIVCVRINERDAEHLPRAMRRARYVLMGSRSRRWLQAQPVPPSAVIVYSGYSPYLLQLTGWARRSRVPILFDAVEWYTAPSLTGFLVSPYLWNTEFAMRVLIPRLDGVVAISRALASYYAGRGLPTARVPPLFDPAETWRDRPLPDPQGRLRLAYAGNPGHKDLLDRVIEAVIATDGGAGRIVLDIAGLTTGELAARAPLRARGGRLPDCLRAHGQMGLAEAGALVAGADFTVLLREVNRVSSCGFSTKVVESLSMGTPVIANLTGDLADHLREGETALVCAAPTAAAMREALARALALSPAERAELRRGARAEAERAFGYANHVASLGELIDRSRRFIETKRFAR